MHLRAGKYLVTEETSVAFKRIVGYGEKMFVLNSLRAARGSVFKKLAGISVIRMRMNR